MEQVKIQIAQMVTNVSETETLWYIDMQFGDMIYFRLPVLKADTAKPRVGDIVVMTFELPKR